MRVQLRKIRHRLRDESGQSLIVVVSSMAVLLGMAGFGIDTATWMVRHHHDQVVADAAALAAANCLANPGQAGSSITINGTVTTMPSCTSDADTTDATTVAIDYAAANGLTITSSQVSFGNDQVTVKASNGSESIFARLFGIDETTQSATSVAGWNSKQKQCTTAGQDCDFMFANSSSCSTGSYALIVSNQGSSAINGNIQSNGSLKASQTGNGGGINGSGTYGPGSCVTKNGGNHDPWNGSQPAKLSATIKWPIDYSKDFPACYPTNEPTVAGESACGQNGFPSYCTVAGKNNILLDPSIPTDAPAAGQIYCSSGSGQPDDPSTWTGNIDINVGGNGNSNVYEDSFVAGTITYTGSGNSTFYACGWTASGFSASGCQAAGPTDTSNYPIFYAVGQDPSTSCATATDSTAGSECAFSMTGSGGLTLYGDAFVPNGTAWLDLHGNQAASDTCIEANVIQATLDGNFNGDGPALITGGGGPIAGGDTLLQ